MENLSRIYSEFAKGLGFKDLPSGVVLQAKKSVLDFLGVALAGSITDSAQIIYDYFSELGGRTETSVLGKKGKLPAIHSAFVNGFFGHILELDDGHRWSAIHPGSPIIPSALAAAELSGASGKELIIGIVVGYEIAIRIGKAINPSHLLRGFHSTGTVGSFGAAAAAGRILGLDSPKIAQALGLAGLHASGLLQVMQEGGMAKPFHPGNAASSGLFSAQMTMKGVTGPEHILEGEKGFLGAMSDRIDSNKLIDGLGKRFEICHTYFKLHAACRHIHPAVDTLLEILKKNSLAPERIQRIWVETYPVALNFCGNTQQKGPLTVSDAKLNLPLALALTAFKGNCSTDAFTLKEIERPEVRRLAERIEMVVSGKWSSLYPEKRGATLSLFIDGKVIQSEVELARGEPENPISRRELHEKFRTNATRAISMEEAQRLEDAIMDLDRVPISKVVKFST